MLARATSAALLLLIPAALGMIGTPAARAQSHPGPAAAGLARAGATSANPRVPGAFLRNPALLGPATDRLRLSAGIRLDARAASNRRTGDAADATSHSPVHPMALAFAAASSSLRVAGLAVGAFYTERGGEAVSFAHRDPGSLGAPSIHDHHRHGALWYRLRRHFYGLALAWQPHRIFSVGVTLAGQTLNLAHSRILWLGPLAASCPDPEASITCDLVGEARVGAKITATGALGLLVRPTRALRFALALEIPAPTELVGRVDPYVARALGDILSIDAPREARTRWRLPTTVRAAVGVDAHRVSFDVEVVYEHRGAPHSPTLDTPGFRVERTDGRVIALPRLPLGFTIRSNLSLAAGLEVVLAPRRLAFAAGYRFRTATTAPGTRSAAWVDPERHTFTAGLSVRLRTLRLDVAYGRIISQSTGANPQALQVAPVSTLPPTAIGAARQTRHGDLIAATLTLDFALGQ